LTNAASATGVMAVCLHAADARNMPTRDDITLLLKGMDDGQPGAMNELMRIVYDDLERMAASHLHRQFGDRVGQITLEPAALVNESFLRLIKQRKGFDNRGQFFGIATRMMLRVLMDYRRRRASRSEKAGVPQRLTLALGERDLEQDAAENAVDVEALSAALNKLDALDTRKADIVKMRVVWGMTMPEIASALAVSQPTVERDWRFVKNWLAEEIESSAA
jgi:RNA polymerase sigma factor (TIGR02999 family)